MKGFTLIEFLIYIAIVAAVLLAAFNFAWQIIYGNVKAQSIREVQQNARFSMEKITRTIETALAINSPLPGDSANSISLEMPILDLNPTIFDVFDNKLRIIQGQRGPYELTNERVIVSNLQFTNLSYENTPGTVQVEMVIDHINPGQRSEYAVSFENKSTISLTFGETIPSYVTQLHYRWRNDDGGE
jgi:prepilin-type N-terminal cleavage/methylation domain-containing protein